MADTVIREEKVRSPVKGLLIRLWRRVDVILFFVFIPVCLAVAYLTGFDRRGRAAGGVILIIVFWVFLVLPLPITSLLPIFLFPVGGVLSSDDACGNYFKSIIFLLMGGILIALALEYSQLHRRFALFCLKKIGTSEKMLLLGFMLPTCVLSMIINNTSTTAIMLPIADAVFLELSELAKADEEFPIDENIVISIERRRRGGDADFTAEAPEPSILDSELEDQSIDTREEPVPYEIEDSSKLQYEKECIFISIAMASNLGGTGTVIGTGPNVFLMDKISKIGKKGEALNYFSWMLFGIPNLTLCMIGAWLWLLGYFYGFKKLFIWRDQDPKRSKRIAQIIRKRYKRLGKLSQHEIFVIIAFFLASIAWVTRKPGFVDGWSAIVFADSKIGDASVGMFFGLLLITIPRRLDFFCWKTSDSRRDFPPSPVLTWNIIHQKVPWGALLIIGCGMCLSDAIDKSGLSAWIAEQFLVLKSMKKEVISAISILFVIIMTSLMSNTAVVSIAIPILYNVSVGLKIHPLYLMFPATICASQAFMFPFSTPPNTLVYEWANLRISRLFGQGLGLNVICGLIMIALINTLGVVLYDLDTYPEDVP